MASVRVNIIANFLGKGWGALISIAFVPVYIKLMGIESYGLVGLFTTLLAISSIFDLGLSAAFTRELARYSANTDDGSKYRTLAYTFQAIHWALGVVLLMILVLVGIFFGSDWVTAKHLDDKSINEAIVLMGIAVALQFPFSLYSGGMLGLERQVPFNVFLVIISTARIVGAWLALVLVAPTIQVFLLWQLLISVVQSIVSGIVLWQFLPPTRKAIRLNFSAVLKVWRFAAGMGLINVFAIVLTQIDKLLLSALLPLNEFGYYILASSIAFGLLLLSAPFYTVLFPHFAKLIQEGNQVTLSTLYHKSSQVLAVVAIPVCITVAVFSKEILLVWTQDAEIATRAHVVVSLLVTGTAASTLMYIPYALQIAHGWTRLSITQNLVSILLLVPLIFFTAKKYGTEGAASIWLLLNLGYIFVSVPVMHRKILKGETWRWYSQAMLLPLIGAVVPIILFHVFFFDKGGYVPLFVQIPGILVLSWICAGLATPSTRLMLTTYISAHWNTKREAGA